MRSLRWFAAALRASPPARRASGLGRRSPTARRARAARTRRRGPARGPARGPLAARSAATRSATSSTAPPSAAPWRRRRPWRPPGPSSARRRRATQIYSGRREKCRESGFSSASTRGEVSSGKLTVGRRERSARWALETSAQNAKSARARAERVRRARGPRGEQNSPRGDPPRPLPREVLLDIACLKHISSVQRVVFENTGCGLGRSSPPSDARRRGDQDDA